MYNRWKWATVKKFPLPRSSLSLWCHPAWWSCLQHTAQFGSQHRGFLNLLPPVFDLTVTLSPPGRLCPYLDLLAHWCVALQCEVRAKPGQLSLWGTQKCSCVKLRGKRIAKKKIKKKHKMFHGFSLQIWCNTTQEYFKTSHSFKHAFYSSLVDDLHFLSSGRSAIEANRHSGSRRVILCFINIQPCTKH